ncbi:MAG: ECF transporter S component [Clostridia bacterium]|nr:ECF transporter S component [Clostridia bacterium]
MSYTKKPINKIKKMTAVAMFCALAYACTCLIKVPVMFLTLDIKDSLIILCSLLFGPFAGLFIAIAVPLLEFITVSDTGIYGLIMNLLSSITFSMVTGMIYRYKKSLMGAIVGLLSGVFAVTAVMMLANLVVTPHFMGTTMDAVASMIPTILLPFNLTKALLNAAIVLLLYKPLSTVLKRIGFLESAPKADSDTAKKKKSVLRSVLISVIAVAIIAGSLAIILFVLQ